MPVDTLPIPEWVDCEAEEIRGLDLLGLRLTAQTIGNSLLSGITTISPTIRYLSIRAWIIRTFELSGLPASTEALEDYAAPIESAIVLGNLLVNPQMSGLVGPDKAHPLVESDDDPLPLERLVSQVAFNIYAGPSEALGLSFVPTDGPLPVLTAERGKPLADEVERAVAGTQVRELLKKGPLPKTLSRDVLRELSEQLRIDTIPTGERTVLVEAIMPKSPKSIAGNDERRRIATYVLLLTLSEQLGREPRESDLFHVVAAPAPDVPATLHEILDGWALYAIRDLLAVVHEAALNAVMSELAVLKDATTFVDARALLRQMLGRSNDISEPLRELGLLEQHESYETLGFQSLKERVYDVTQPAEIRNGMRRWSGGFDEAALRRLVQNGGVGSLGILPVAWILAERRIDRDQAEGMEAAEELSRRGWSRIGLHQIIVPALKKWQEQNADLPDVVYEIARRTVEQHLRIAWSRLVTDMNRDVALLVADGNRWYFRKTFRHGRAASRIREAVGWLRQLGLVDQGGITEAGSDCLQRGREILTKTSSGGDS